MASPPHLDADAIATSWMSLVAATTTGLPPLRRIVCRVGCPTDARLETGEVCVVVQAYAPPDLVLEPGRRFAPRPVGAAHRWIAADALRRGTSVEVFVESAETTCESLALVAWVEPCAGREEIESLNSRPGRLSRRIHVTRVPDAQCVLHGGSCAA